MEGGRKGLAEGRAEGRVAMVRRMLLSRSIEVSEDFPADVPGFADSPLSSNRPACRRSDPGPSRAVVPDHERDLVFAPLGPPSCA